MTYAIVKFQAEGFHNWPEAPAKRAYLRAEHRHLFHVVVKVQLFEDDREIEFHDLLDFCKLYFVGGRMGRKSCEQMGRELGEAIEVEYPGRIVQVEVWEDGEVGALVVLGK